MLDWLSIVRLADVDAIRWALAAYQDDHSDGPVSIRRANHWIARMAEVGYLGRVRPMYRDRQIVWPTLLVAGRSAPRLFRQTMRHELAVASVSARYLARGYTWRRDARPQSLQDHQVDGVAMRADGIELVEVELTVKKLSRYRLIHAHHGTRLSDGRATRVLYVCAPNVARIVAREADKFLFRSVRGQLDTIEALDSGGKWVGDEDALWCSHEVPRSTL